MRYAAPLSLFLLLLLGACAGVRTPADPAAAEAHRQEAENLVRAKNYPAAVEELAKAIARAPSEGDLYLRRGELLEALDRAGEAAVTYREGRRALSDRRGTYPELAYRLALHAALEERDIDRATELAAELSADSPERIDLQGLLALLEGRPRDALTTFNQALTGKIPKPVAARILFHAALAYHRLGAQEPTFSALFQAINLTEDLGVSRRIEIFWKRVQAPEAWETASPSP